MPSLTSRVKSRTIAAPGVRSLAVVGIEARAVVLIARSGLFDPAWYTRQTGRRFSTAASAVRDYVVRGRGEGASPHPLFEPAWIEPETWQSRLTDPLAHYLLSRSRRRHRDPHPLFAVSVYREAHPEADAHPGGPLLHFLATATDSTPLPVPEALLGPRDGRPPTWGEFRAAADAATDTWRAQRALAGPRQVYRFDTARERAWRRRIAPAAATPLRTPAAGPDSTADTAPVVTVVMPTWNRAPLLRRAVGSVQAQTLRDWELLIVDDGSTDDTDAVLAGLGAFDERIRVLRVPHAGVSTARNVGIEAARGAYTAFLDSDNVWEPDFLALMVAGMRDAGLRFGYSAMRLERAGRVTWRAFEGGRAHLAVGNHIDLNVLVAATSLIREVGGFDTTLRRAVDYDLVLRLADRAEPGYLPFVGAVYSEDGADPSRISVSQPKSWDTVVRARHAVHWPDEAAVRTDTAGLAADAAPVPVPGRVSVLVPVPLIWNSAVSILRRLTAELPGPATGDVEILVLDRAGSRAAASVLAAQAVLDPRVRSRRVPSDPGFPAGIDQLAVAASGTTSVVVEPSMTLEAGWLEALAAALTPGVLATGALLLERDGSVSSAGAVFFPGVDLPLALLAGLPGSEALPGSGALSGQVEPTAPMSPAIAVRTADLLAVHGLDPLFTSVLADVDLGLRLAALPGRAGDAVVTVPEALALRTGDPLTDGPQAAVDQLLFAQRWSGRVPTAAAAGWASVGLDLAHVHGARGANGVISIEPVVVRLPHDVDPAVFPDIARVVHGAAPAPTPTPGRGRAVPSLRWAIMTAAPVGRRRREWGDWYFAEALAGALRRLGQDAVVNPRGDVRPAGYLDDVALTLRGLRAVPCDPATVNLLWVISHPDLVTPTEVLAHDATFAASFTWAQRMSLRAGVAVEPLLQCTDAGRFSPAAAAAVAVDPEAVLFVGNSRRVRRHVVEAALAVGADLAVWGSGWGTMLPEGVFQGRHVPNEQLAAHYAAAGVVLNDHWDDMRAEGFISNRLFDVVASGGRVISDRVAGIEEIFGESVRVFDQREELAELLTRDPDEVFGPAALRGERAARILAEHSFDARAARLLEVVLQRRG